MSYLTGLCLGLNLGGSPFIMEQEEEELSKAGPAIQRSVVRETEGSIPRRERSVGSNFAERVRKLGTEKRLEFHQ